MKKQEHISEEVEKTLNSLDNWQPVKTDPFFYTRLQARMQKRQEEHKWAWFFDSALLKPALAVAIVAINVVTLIHYSNQTSQAVSRDEAIESFTNEYALNQSMDVYFYESEE